MSAPTTLSEALHDGWGDEDFYGSADSICVEQVDENTRRRYAEASAAEQMAARNGRPLSSAVIEITRAGAGDTARPMTGT